MLKQSSPYGLRNCARPQAPSRTAIPGLETICIELAARFCVDIYQDSYFGWNDTRFPSRRAHNLTRARGQLALGLSVAARRDELQSTWLLPF